jgi:hypothetical protein
MCCSYSKTRCLFRYRQASMSLCPKCTYELSTEASIHYSLTTVHKKPHYAHKKLHHK